MIRPTHGLRWTRLPTNQSNFDSKNLKKESHENGYNVHVTMERDRKHLKILLILINIGSLVLHVGNYRTRVSPSRTIVHMGTSSSATTDVLLSLSLSSLLPPTRSIRSPPIRVESPLDAIGDKRSRNDSGSHNCCPRLQRTSLIARPRFSYGFILRIAFLL